MTGEMIWGVARAVLAAVGGILVAKGLLDDSTLQQMLGAVGVLFVGLWSIWSKRVV